MGNRFNQKNQRNEKLRADKLCDLCVRFLTQRRGEAKAQGKDNREKCERNEIFKPKKLCDTLREMLAFSA
jgi:uncharacterized protein YutE (UPF0331/DUF86 family)